MDPTEQLLRKERYRHRNETRHRVFEDRLTYEIELELARTIDGRIDELGESRGDAFVGAGQELSEAVGRALTAATRRFGDLIQRQQRPLVPQMGGRPAIPPATVFDSRYRCLVCGLPIPPEDGDNTWVCSTHQRNG